VGAFAPGQNMPAPADRNDRPAKAAPAPSRPKKGSTAAPGFGF
jgi:pilus assembly protein CpaC